MIGATDDAETFGFLSVLLRRLLWRFIDGGPVILDRLVDSLAIEAVELARLDMGALLECIRALRVLAEFELHTRQIANMATKATNAPVVM